MRTYNGPSPSALTMARFLKSMQEFENAPELPEDVWRAAEGTIAWHEGEMRMIRAAREAEDKRTAAKNALFDSDTPVTDGSGCEERVYDRWSYRGRACPNKAKWLRHWTVSEYRGVRVGDAVLDFSDFRAFLTANPDVEDNFERVNENVVKEAKLCGMHRRKKYAFGNGG